MQRTCSQCGCEYRPQDLAREESKGMEQERKANGLAGVAFRFYHCSACGHDDIFLDLHPLAGETTEAFRKRRADLEAAARAVADAQASVVLVQR